MKINEFLQVNYLRI